MDVFDGLAALVDKAPIAVGDTGANLLEEIFKSLAYGKETLIRKTLRLGMVEGESIPDLTRRMMGTRKMNYTDGLLQIPRRHATAMVRTIVNSTSNAAANLVYRENGDLIKGLRWTSTLDGRTSPICRARDGEIFPVDSGPRPPAHVNCRSFIVPILKSWKELGIPATEMDEGTRASMNGQVPGDTTYQTWLKDQPEEFQRDVLGPARFALFQKGIPLDRFVAEGRPFSLSEIRSRR